jgi:hypothetical protein
MQFCWKKCVDPNASAVCRPSLTTARHSQRVRMTRSTGRLILIPVQTATCNTKYELSSLEPLGLSPPQHPAPSFAGLGHNRHHQPPQHQRRHQRGQGLDLM